MCGDTQHQDTVRKMYCSSTFTVFSVWFIFFFVESFWTLFLCFHLHIGSVIGFKQQNHIMLVVCLHQNIFTSLVWFLQRNKAVASQTHPAAHSSCFSSALIVSHKTNPEHPAVHHLSCKTSPAESSHAEHSLTIIILSPHLLRPHRSFLATANDFH